jgi:DNA invertase Pin-like site-specific DNA recombinase
LSSHFPNSSAQISILACTAAKDIVDDLTRREVKLSIGGSVHDPTDPVGRLLFNLLAMVAEFEADLIR